ncbi:MAG: response regulator [Acidobacteriota bacterium]
MQIPDSKAAGPQLETKANKGVSSGGSQLRILVVDDNDDATDILAQLLKLKGHDVRSERDGPSALKMAAAFQPEFILLDIGLPGMDGYEVARRVRQAPVLSKVTLVALTGYGQERDRQQSKSAGFDHHLVKPVDPEALLALFASKK